MLLQFLKRKIANELGVSIEKVNSKLIREARKSLKLREPRGDLSSTCSGYPDEFLEIQDEDEIKATEDRANRFLIDFL